jgi:putative endonuclease
MCKSMYTVYVLYSERYNKIYVGFTSDLEKRFLSHNELGIKGWTKNFRPWKIIHSEIFETKVEAMNREKQLKSSKGRETIREIIKAMEQ